MASYQRSKSSSGVINWRVQLCINGIRDSKGGFETKADAKLWAAQRELELLNELSRSAPVVPQIKHTLRDVFQRYSDEVSPTKIGAHWEQIRLAAFCRHPFVNIYLSELGPQHIAAWRDERLKSVSNSTVKRELVLISHSLEIARREWRWINENSCRDVRKPMEPPHRKQRISDENIQKLIGALGYVEGRVPSTQSHQVAIALLFCIETACRSGEVIGLTKANVHLKEHFIHLPVTKNGYSRDVPLSPKAEELLSLMLKAGSPRAIRVFSIKATVKDVLFRRAKKRVGLEHINFHDSRREATSRLSEIFGPMELSRITGHRDLKMLMRYYEKPVGELAKKLMETRDDD